MDVRIDGGYYAPAPPSPTTGGGDFAPAPTQESFAPPTPVAPPPEERAERSESADSLRRAVNEINSSLAIHRRHLGIRHHEPTNRRIVTVYDSETNEAIRHIPPESVLEAHANMLEMVGLFVNERG
jgi:uncharacterized FlaG/YvyC family protein